MTTYPAEGVAGSLDYDGPNNQTGSADENNYLQYLQAMTDTAHNLGLGSVYWAGLKTSDPYSLTTVSGSGTALTLTVVNQSGIDRLKYAWGQGTPVSQTTTKLVATASGKCLDVPGGSQAIGTYLDISACSGGSNQTWTTNNAGELIVYGNKCLDGYNQGTGAGTPVDIYTCNGGANQQWIFGSSGQIIEAQSGLCLDVTGGSVSNGAAVDLWTCNGGSNQQWMKSPGEASAAPGTITSDAPWTDTAGNPLEAHGAGIFKVGATYYMVGEDKTAGPTFTAVACYSSTDLSTWTRQADALSQQPAGDLSAGNIIERPKVIFNAATQKYVMYMHVDNANYSEARVGVATSNTPCGPYTYLGSFQPLGFQSRDIGLYQDTDGSAYLLSEDRSNGLRIDALSADYTSVVSSVAVLEDLEAPAMVKVNGVYFIFGSHLSGWSSNDNVYATATSLGGPWSTFSAFAFPGSGTYNSQTSFVLPVSGSSTTSYMYIGDRWNPSNLNASVPIWLPMKLSGTTASMAFSESWNINTSTGVTTPLSTSIVGGASGRCVDVPNNSQANGTQVEIWDCKQGENQQWLPTAAGELRVYGASQCLEVQLNGSAASGAAVGINSCNGGNNQKWTFNANGTLTSQLNGLCLDASGGGTENGTLLDIWTCNGQANQQWARL